MARLNTYVHVVERDDEGHQTGNAATFGPADDLPDWVVAAIDNPRVWAEPPADAPVEPEGPAPVPPPGGHVPPRGGPGSSRAAWAQYASTHNVEVTDEMRTRDDVIAACVAAGVAVE